MGGSLRTLRREMGRDHLANQPAYNMIQQDHYYNCMELLIPSDWYILRVAVEQLRV